MENMTEVVESEFTVNDIPIGKEMFVWTKTDKYTERYGESPATAIKSGDTYFMPTPKSPLSIEELTDIINKKKGAQSGSTNI